jgi:hypothetical protein
MRLGRLGALGALACALVACSSSSDEAPAAQPAQDATSAETSMEHKDSATPAADVSSSVEDVHPFTYSPCSLAERLGGFTVTLADDYTGVNGEVADGVVPGNVPILIAEGGDCRLLQKPSLFCAPACVPGETCGSDGTCVAYPENQSVGTVEVTGLKSALSMEAKWGNYYGNPGTMEHPGFEPGALVTLRAAGEDLPTFTLGGVGVTPLSISNPQISIDDDDGLLLEWSAAPGSEAIQMHVELNINNHGSTSAWISCDSPDSGTLEIPQALLAELFQIGVSGFPSLTFSRRSAHSTQLNAGCVELVVRTDQDVSIEVAGVTSCTSDGQCGPGESCGADLQCSEP